MSEPFNVAGHRGLVAAIILQAFKDLRIMSEADGVPPETIRRLAWDWIHKPVTWGRDPDTHADPRSMRLSAFKTGDIGGFEWCCGILDLDPEFYRMKSMTREGIASILGKHGNNQHHVR
jgi:hypothetical protein